MSEKTVEAEVRSFLSKEDYHKLIDYMKNNAEFVDKDYQVTYWFKCQQDLRIQKNKKFAKLWMKKGKLHDKSREEMEVKINRKDFDKLEEFLNSLGFETDIKWFRDRHKFNWDGYKVSIDYTKGFGYVIEIEKVCSEEEKDKVYRELTEKLKSLGIKPSKKQEFEEVLEYYKNNWRVLTCLDK